jgi:hypothetical protein
VIQLWRLCPIKSSLFSWYTGIHDFRTESVLVLLDFRKWTRSESGVRSWLDNAQVEAIAHE